MLLSNALFMCAARNRHMTCDACQHDEADICMGIGLDASALCWLSLQCSIYLLYYTGLFAADKKHGIGG